MSEQIHLQERLTDVEERLTNVESLLVSINAKLELHQAVSPTTPQESQAQEGPPTDNNGTDAAQEEALKQWVTDYVSMRLQQLVPETCVHPAEAPVQDGPFLDNTNVPCTEEVVHRVKRIPIPFVREMVVQRVAENAREAQIERVDIEFFEKAATF